MARAKVDNVAISNEIETFQGKENKLSRAVGVDQACKCFSKNELIRATEEKYDL